MSNQFVGREEILGLEEILGREEILGGMGAQNFVGRQEILGLEEILGNAALEEIVSSGTFVDGDEVALAREGGTAEKKALARRFGRSTSCGYNSHWAHIRGEDTERPSLKVASQRWVDLVRKVWKKDYPIRIDQVSSNQMSDKTILGYPYKEVLGEALKSNKVVLVSNGSRLFFNKDGRDAFVSGTFVGDDLRTKQNALDTIRPIAARKATLVLAAYQKDGSISDGIKKCIVLLDKVDAGDESAKARYQRRRAKALSGASHKSMDYWADLYAAAQLRKVLQQKGVKIAGDDVDGRRQAREILDSAANATPKQITKSDLKRAIDLWAGPQATKEEKLAVGAKMMSFIDKRKIKLAA